MSEVLIALGKTQFKFLNKSISYRFLVRHIKADTPRLIHVGFFSWNSSGHSEKINMTSALQILNIEINRKTGEPVMVRL